MLSRLKSLPLVLLLLLATLSHATEIGCGFDTLPKYGAPIGNPMYKEDDFYTYKLAFDRENELYMYKFKKDGSGMEVRHYARLQNNYEITHHTGFSTQVFYRFACPSAFPTLIYPLRKFDVNNDPKINTAKYIIDVYAVDTDFSVQYCKLGYDLANHKCADDCEYITDKELRFDCACKKKFPGSKYTGIFSSDPNVCKTPDISFTPKCCFSCGNGKTIVVNSANEYADYGCNYDETDHLHLENPKPKPDPDKPDKPDKPNPDKPDKPNPDKPNPGGGGGKPGGGGNKPDKPGDDDKGKDKNNTHPGGGGKPGDKEDDKGKFNPKDFDDGGLDKARDDLYGGIKDHLNNGLSKFDGLRNGIDQFIKNIKGKGFAKVKSEIKRSCPIKKQITLSDGKTYDILVDYCDAVSPVSEISYYVFYVGFVVGAFLLFLKLLVISLAGV